AAEVLDTRQLAGGVAGQGQRQVVRLDAAAVIDHPDEVEAAVADLGVDACGAGVDGVLQQLLEDAGRSLDDLAGGDLADEHGRQLLDAWHRGRPVGRAEGFRRTSSIVTPGPAALRLPVVWRVPGITAIPNSCVAVS